MENEILEETPKQFFESLDLDKLDVNTCNYVCRFLDSPEAEMTDQLGDVDDFVQLRDLILSEYPDAVKRHEALEAPPVEVTPAEPELSLEQKIQAYTDRISLIRKLIAKGKVGEEVGNDRISLIEKLTRKAEAKLAAEKPTMETGGTIAVATPAPVAVAPVIAAPAPAVVAPEAVAAPTPTLATGGDALPKRRRGKNAPVIEFDTVDLIQYRPDKKAAKAYIERFVVANPEALNRMAIENRGRRKFAILHKKADGGHVGKNIDTLYYAVDKTGKGDWKKLPKQSWSNLTWKDAHQQAVDLAKAENAEVWVGTTKDSNRHGHFFKPDMFEEGGTVKGMKAEKAKVLILTRANPLHTQLKRIYDGDEYHLFSLHNEFTGKPIDDFIFETQSGDGYITYTPKYLENMTFANIVDELEYYKWRYGIKELDMTAVTKYFEKGEK